MVQGGSPTLTTTVLGRAGVVPDLLTTGELSPQPSPGYLRWVPDISSDIINPPKGQGYSIPTRSASVYDNTILSLAGIFVAFGENGVFV